MKRNLIILAIVLVAGGVYYTGLYTFFLKTEVQENMPAMDVGSVKSGSFVDIDLIHKGSGIAKLITDGSKSIIRLEDFKVTNGPDLHINLSKNEDGLSNDIESLGGYIDLGKLKGNIGSQNYEVNEDIEGYNTVVIWCEKFSVLFSYAVLN